MAYGHVEIKGGGRLETIVRESNTTIKPIKLKGEQQQQHITTTDPRDANTLVSTNPTEPK